MVKPVATFSLATTEAWKDRDGTRKEKTEWHRIVFYMALAEVAGEYLKKGTLVYLEGKLRTREWMDKEGIKRSTTEMAGNLLKMLRKKPQAHPIEGTPLEEEEDIPF
jgi:single-strand DNA-binding protein